MRSIIQGQNAPLIMDLLQVRILLDLVFFLMKNVEKESQFDEHSDRSRQIAFNATLICDTDLSGDVVPCG